MSRKKLPFRRLVCRSLPRQFWSRRHRETILVARDTESSPPDDAKRRCWSDTSIRARRRWEGEGEVGGPACLTPLRQGRLAAASVLRIPTRRETAGKNVKDNGMCRVAHAWLRGMRPRNGTSVSHGVRHETRGLIARNSPLPPTVHRQVKGLSHNAAVA